MQQYENQSGIACGALSEKSSLMDRQAGALKQEKHVAINQALGRLKEVEFRLSRLVERIAETVVDGVEKNCEDKPKVSLAGVLTHAPQEIDRHTKECVALINQIEEQLF